MAGFTNHGLKIFLNSIFRNLETPTGFKIALATNTYIPTSTGLLAWSQLTEINPGNGYTAGGTTLTKGINDFDVIYEDDGGGGLNRAYIQLRDVSWTAAGGPIPSGAGAVAAYYAVLYDTSASGNVIGYWDLNGARSITDGQMITLVNFELRLNQS
jgi:hypothetical protein